MTRKFKSTNFSFANIGQHERNNDDVDEDKGSYTSNNNTPQSDMKYLLFRDNFIFSFLFLLFYYSLQQLNNIINGNDDDDNKNSNIRMIFSAIFIIFPINYIFLRELLVGK